MSLSFAFITKPFSFAFSTGGNDEMPHQPFLECSLFGRLTFFGSGDEARWGLLTEEECRHWSNFVRLWRTGTPYNDGTGEVMDHWRLKVGRLWVFGEAFGENMPGLPGMA